MDHSCQMAMKCIFSSSYICYVPVICHANIVGTTVTMKTLEVWTVVKLTVNYVGLFQGLWRKLMSWIQPAFSLNFTSFLFALQLPVHMVLVQAEPGCDLQFSLFWRIFKGIFLSYHTSRKLVGSNQPMGWPMGLLPENLPLHLQCLNQIYYSNILYSPPPNSFSALLDYFAYFILFLFCFQFLQNRIEFKQSNVLNFGCK